jgi:hypothetical protein
MTITATSSDFFTSAFLSFGRDGEISGDRGDAPKLLPLQASPRLAAMTIMDSSALKINHLPFQYDGTLAIPLDILALEIDSIGNFITQEQEVNLVFNISELPDHITYSILDNSTGLALESNNSPVITITTEEKGSFSPIPIGPVSPYPVIGGPGYTILIHYGTLSQNENTGLPTKYALHQNYPNPFNPTTSISFSVPSKSKVEINVYNIMGNEVDILLNDVVPSGIQSVSWDAKDQPSGIYFIRMLSENFIEYIPLG